MRIHFTHTKYIVYKSEYLYIIVDNFNKKDHTMNGAVKLLVTDY